MADMPSASVAFSMMFGDRPREEVSKCADRTLHVSFSLVYEIFRAQIPEMCITMVGNIMTA